LTEDKPIRAGSKERSNPLPERLRRWNESFNSTRALQEDSSRGFIRLHLEMESLLNECPELAESVAKVRIKREKEERRWREEMSMGELRGEIEVEIRKKTQVERGNEEKFMKMVRVKIRAMSFSRDIARFAERFVGLEEFLRQGQ